MLFLLNNPVLFVIVLVLTGFMVYIGMKIFSEIKLNQMLNLKQSAMRISTPNVGLKKRIGLLTSAALAPAVALALVFTVGANTTLIPTGDILAVHDANDIVDIYESFQGRKDSSYQFNFFSNNIGERAIFNTSLTTAFLEEAGADYTTSDQGSDDYSETNNQVIGVDEMDNVVTDGKYIYTIHQNQVIITLAYTQELEADALSSYKEIVYLDEETECPTGFYVSGLYVDEDYLVVIGSDYEYYCNPSSEDDTKEDVFINDIWIWNYNRSSNVKVYVYDKAEDFALDSEYEISGNLLGTRKIEDDLYIVTSTYIPFYQEDVIVEDYLPSYIVSGVEVEAEYRDIVYIEGTSPNSFTTFYALDLDHEQVDMEVILGDSSYNLYVSPDNMYLVGNIYYFEPLTEFIDVEDPVSETRTAVLKVSIDGPNVEYDTTGVVLGFTLNQFSMDEYDGNLRIATTTGSWGDSINNRLFVLDENLNEISRIENIGKPGETIKSVRFSGEYGYVVTFRQTDPFYVLNLEDPSNPFKEGELEIPGFSTYLQPMGEDFMLGIGFGDSNGGTQGLKISIYDIRDKENPVVFDEVIFDYVEFGWSSSTATYNHKDLLVSLSKGLIALPFSTRVYDQTNGYKYNSGILVYNFDETNGLTYKGFVTHEKDAVENVYVYKSKFIADYFYTISNKYIKVSTLLEPETIINETELVIQD